MKLFISFHLASGSLIELYFCLLKNIRSSESLFSDKNRELRALGEYLFQEWLKIEIHNEWSLKGKCMTPKLTKNSKLSTRITSSKVIARVIRFSRVGLMIVLLSPKELQNSCKGVLCCDISLLRSPASMISLIEQIWVLTLSSRQSKKPWVWSCGL